MSKRTYGVMVPMAGHAYVEVEAETKEEAISEALDLASLDHVEGLEAIRRFHQGNVCYCPTPWEAQADVVYEPYLTGDTSEPTLSDKASED